MSARKLSVSMDEGIAEAVSESAKRQGQSLSSWLTNAAKLALEQEVGRDAVEKAEKEKKIKDGLAAIAEWEAENGAITKEEIAKAEAILDGKLEVRP